jgi:hypothetical protein
MCVRRDDVEVGRVLLNADVKNLNVFLGKVSVDQHMRT